MMFLKNVVPLLTVLTLITYSLRRVTAELSESELDKKIRSIFGDGGNEIEEKGPNTETELNLSKCECVPYYLCIGDRINTIGEGIIDVRSNDNVCDNLMERCCHHQDINRTAIPPPQQANKGCGYRNPSGVAGMELGDNQTDARFGEFPWIVGILSEKINDSHILNAYVCGGSLIHPLAVITAAHCVREAHKTYKIRAGEWDTNTRLEILEHQERRVKSIIIHPDFYNGALHNDIALLILEEPVELDQHISIACLPQSSTTITPGAECWSGGWGKDLFGVEGRYSVKLKKRDLPFVDRDKCQSLLRTTRLGRFFVLHGSFVCAGGVKGKDTCVGDGGSPLVCPIPEQKDRYQQVGIVAWGIGCGENGIPGVYANVALFRKWIDDKMTAHNLDISLYQYQEI